jgi:hypothetical protein
MNNVTDSGVDGQGSIPGIERDFPLCCDTKTANQRMWCCFFRVQKTKRKDGHSRPCSSEAKGAWSFTPSSPIRLDDRRTWNITFWLLAEIISSTLKIEVKSSSVTSVDTQRTTRRYIPEDNTLQNHRL